MKNILCLLGFHKWGRMKQFIFGGSVFLAQKCKRCPTLKDKIGRLHATN